MNCTFDPASFDAAAFEICVPAVPPGGAETGGGSWDERFLPRRRVLEPVTNDDELVLALYMGWQMINRRSL